MHKIDKKYVFQMVKQMYKGKKIKIYHKNYHKLLFKISLLKINVLSYKETCKYFKNNYKLI